MQLNTGQWIVEAVLARSRKKNRDYFLVKWKGFPSPTWEPSASLRGGNLHSDMRDAPLYDDLPADQQYQLLNPPLAADISFDVKIICLLSS